MLCDYRIMDKFVDQQNPGPPPRPVTVSLKQRPYRSNDSLSLLVYCSDLLVKVNLSLFVKYSSHLLDLVAASAPCR